MIQNPTTTQTKQNSILKQQNREEEFHLYWILI